VYAAKISFGKYQDEANGFPNSSDEQWCIVNLARFVFSVLENTKRYDVG